MWDACGGRGLRALRDSGGKRPIDHNGSSLPRRPPPSSSGPANGLLASIKSHGGAAQLHATHRHRPTLLSVPKLPPSPELLPPRWCLVGLSAPTPHNLRARAPMHPPQLHLSPAGGVKNAVKHCDRSSAPFDFFARRSVRAVKPLASEKTTLRAGPSAHMQGQDLVCARHDTHYHEATCPIAATCNCSAKASDDRLRHCITSCGHPPASTKQLLPTSTERHFGCGQGGAPAINLTHKSTFHSTEPYTVAS